MIEREYSNLAVQPQFVNPASQREQGSLAQFYDVRAEIRFVNKFFPPEDSNIREYLRNQVLRFIEEFVFRLPRQRIVYWLGEDGKLYAPGMDTPIEESYITAANLALASGYKRETAELEGFLKIQDALAHGEETVVYFSPPSFGREGFGDYSFVFIFQRADQGIYVDIFRLDGEDRNLSKVKASFKEVEALTKSFEDLSIEFSESVETWTTEDFLRNPIIVDKRVPYMLSFNRQTFEENSITENLFQDPLFVNFFEEYVKAVKIGDANRAMLLLRAMYARAEEIKKVLNERGEERVFAEEISQEGWNQLMFYYASQSISIPSGSCPVTGGVEGSINPLGMLTYLSVAPFFQESDQYGSLTFTCPYCGAEVRRPFGELLSTCPHCGEDVSCGSAEKE